MNMRTTTIKIVAPTLPLLRKVSTFGAACDKGVDRGRLRRPTRVPFAGQAWRLCAALWLASASMASAQIPSARVGDVTHPKGQGINRINGYGLVSGLDGTGDGDGYLDTMQRVAAMMQRFGSSVSSLSDLKGTKNVAIVSVEAIIGEHGVREGDRLDVMVTAHAAKSLVGGRLIPTPLIYMGPGTTELYAIAAGRIIVDPDSPNSGVIKGGAVMERDRRIPDVAVSGAVLRAQGFGSRWIDPDETYFTLVLDDAHAGWPMAAAIAQALDKELGLSADVDRVALAMDPKNVVVLIPSHQRGDTASWIRDVQRTPILMESNEARVTINRNAGTIVITGDTRMSPVIVSQRGMTITVYNPLPDGTVPTSPFDEREFVELDPGDGSGANVSDLLAALNTLKVPFAERVAILEQIHRAGKLHAPIVYEQ